MKIHDFDQILDLQKEDSKKYSTEYYPSGVIPMWIAETDFRAPEPVVEALVKRAREGVFGYTPVSQRLRGAVKGWEERRFGFFVEESEVEYVPGVIGGIICALRALTRPGDRVILQTPSYPPFRAAIENNGRRLAPNPLILDDGGYRIDFEGFEELCRQPRTKAFILCNPHNPTGRVLTKEELTRLGEICLRHHVTVLSDEIHCDLVFKGYRHLPFAGLSPELAQITATFINPSKTFNLPGLRTAAMICKNPRMKEEIHQVILSNKAVGETIFGTLGLCVAYEECDYYADQVVEYLDRNRDILRQRLQQIPSIRWIQGQGTFLMWLDCRKLELAQDKLMERFVFGAQVGVQSGTDFGAEGEGFVRMNIGCPSATLCLALDRVQKEFQKG